MSPRNSARLIKPFVVYSSVQNTKKKQRKKIATATTKSNSKTHLMRWAITFAFALRRSTSGGSVCRCDMNSNSIFHARYQSQSKRDKNEKKKSCEHSAPDERRSVRWKPQKGNRFCYLFFLFSFLVFVSCCWCCWCCRCSCFWHSVHLLDCSCDSLWGFVRMASVHTNRFISLSQPFIPLQNE